MKRVIVFTLLAVMLAGVFAGCGESKTPAEPSISVTTRYGILYFPEKWEGLLKTTQVEGDDSVEVTFSAVVRDIEMPLCVVTIGAENGVLIGTIRDDAKVTRNVYLTSSEIVFDESITAEEQHSILSMQEDLNYLIDSLNK